MRSQTTTTKSDWHGRSHRSRWSGFNRTTFQRESNEYSILNCLLRANAISLLPRRGRHVLKFALIAANEALPTLSDEPKASFAFPKRSFGKSKPILCSAQSHWFSSWPFLHYDEGVNCLPHELSALALWWLHGCRQGGAWEGWSTPKYFGNFVAKAPHQCSSAQRSTRSSLATIPTRTRLRTQLWLVLDCGGTKSGD